MVEPERSEGSTGCGALSLSQSYTMTHNSIKRPSLGNLQHTILYYLLSVRSQYSSHTFALVTFAEPNVRNGFGESHQGEFALVTFALVTFAEPDGNR